MNRKEFLKLTTGAVAAVNGLSITSVFAHKYSDQRYQKEFRFDKLAKVSDELNNKFLLLVEWLKQKGWADFFKSKLQLDLYQTGNFLIDELTKDINKNGTQLLSNLKKEQLGFDDFAGNCLINPGNPALSLLYHALASARVKPFGNSESQYPLIEQLDVLENYIYALRRWEDYDIQINDELVLSVFAYEYRPAYKTPHHAHADMVYSRTGIARIGDEPMNYDAPNRCYTNKPKTSDDPTGKRIAVTPARYGLFLAKVVPKDKIAVMSTKKYKGKHSFLKKLDDIYDDHRDDKNFFLLPIRKVFNSDLLFDGDGTWLNFRENHVSDKLFALRDKLTVLIGKPELKRLSNDLVETNPTITNVGSSFLLISQNKPLIRLFTGVILEVDNNPQNRYFTSYSEKRPEGFVIEILQGNYRDPNKYKVSRNKPMYIHLAHQVNKNGEVSQIPKTEAERSSSTVLMFEDIINNGKYSAPIYEDSICDGVVTVDLSNLKSVSLENILKKEVFPAFSIVTAPDFFPYVDLFDLIDYDVAPGNKEESNFYEGGVASLASARIRPNPTLANPNNPTLANPNNPSNYAFHSSSNADKLYNTFTAVLSLSESQEYQWSNDYTMSSFLPDVCSSVFAPGWDITFANNDLNEDRDTIFLSTQGLGSPFVEDMKLCAAMNGMWAVASPDAARVFQGTVNVYEHENYGWRRNPTAIPLMDEELGFHTESPKASNLKESTGWDGEQGAFLQLHQQVWENNDSLENKWGINFTDLGRADYVQNYLEGKFDMSKLRELSSKELIARMSALKKCIDAIDNGGMVALTQLWLISAEKLKNKIFEGNGIPINLIGNTKDWATTLQFGVNADKNCYLFVFADTVKDKNQSERRWTETGVNVKRRWQKCNQLYCCQVSDSNIWWSQIINNGEVVSKISWNS